MNRMLLLQGGLYTLIGGLTPVSIILASDAPLNTRSIACLIVGALIAGGNALKAFLSTTFSESSASVPDKPNSRDGTNTTATPPLWQSQT